MAMENDFQVSVLKCDILCNVGSEEYVEAGHFDIDDDTRVVVRV